MLVMPFWSGSLPGIWKVLAAFWMSALFAFIVPPTIKFEEMSLHVLIIGGVMEFLIGALMGFIVNVFFGGIMLAGQLAGVQMGLGVANLLDPSTSERRSAIAQWMNLLALFLFLEMDGHLMAVRLVATSFEWIPPFSAEFSRFMFFDLVCESGRELFRTGLQIAWPISTMLLSVYVCMGLLAKMAPKMNMMMSAFPITILTGLSFLMVSIYPIHIKMEQVFLKAFYYVEQILIAMRG